MNLFDALTWQEKARRIGAAFEYSLPAPEPCAMFYSPVFEWYKVGWRVEYQIGVRGLWHGAFFSLFSHSPREEHYWAWIDFPSKDVRLSNATHRVTAELEHRFYWALWLLDCHDLFDSWCEERGLYFSAHDKAEHAAQFQRCYRLSAEFF